MVDVHPYLTDLPVFEAEIDSIAESIHEVGLLHPITLDAEGLLIGGRHRLAACEKAGVKPTFETWDGDVLAFVLHDNATRKHQTAGQRAAENALTMATAGRRRDGRWKYGDVREFTTGGKSAAQRLTECGIVLDFLGRGTLVEIATGEADLKTALRDAEIKRDAERNLLAEQQRLEAEETDARKRLEETAPDYLDRFDNARTAYAAWESDNRREAARIRQEKAQAEEAERMERVNGEQAAQALARAITTLGVMEHPEARARNIQQFRAYGQAVTDRQRNKVTPANIRNLSSWLLAFADELEGNQP